MKMSATSLVRQYRYIMVDEYQDTNTIQADIVSWLAHEHQNIMVVGDDCPVHLFVQGGQLQEYV